MPEYCRNCSNPASEMQSGGLRFEGDLYCNRVCAEMCAGYWSRGHGVPWTEDSDAGE